eukprot:jgi/Hompol1/5124/HPOL_000435-RA
MPSKSLLDIDFDELLGPIPQAPIDAILNNSSTAQLPLNSTTTPSPLIDTDATAKPATPATPGCSESPSTPSKYTPPPRIRYNTPPRKPFQVVTQRAAQHTIDDLLDWAVIEESYDAQLNTTSIETDFSDLVYPVKSRSFTETTLFLLNLAVSFALLLTTATWTLAMTLIGATCDGVDLVFASSSRIVSDFANSDLPIGIAADSVKASEHLRKPASASASAASASPSPSRYRRVSHSDPFGSFSETPASRLRQSSSGSSNSKAGAVH